MRRNLDAYYTPEKAVESLRQQLDGTFNPWDKMFEPCNGNGSISNVFKKANEGQWLTADIDPSVKPDVVMDSSSRAEWAKLNSNGIKHDWVITNPPFNCAFDILKNGMEFANEGVILLLRLSFLEPTLERGSWLQQNPPDKIIVLPRISFTGDGKCDSVTCCWMIWDKKNYRFLNPISFVPKEKK